MAEPEENESTGERASDPLAEIFRVRLRDLRTQSRLSRNALAEKSGVSMAAIALYERGKREPILTQLAKLARGLECSVQELAPLWGLLPGRFASQIEKEPLPAHQEKAARLEEKIRHGIMSVPHLIGTHLYCKRAVRYPLEAHRRRLTDEEFEEWWQTRKTSRLDLQRTRGWSVQTISQAQNLIEFAAARGPYRRLRDDREAVTEQLLRLRAPLERPCDGITLWLTHRTYHSCYLVYDRTLVRIKTPHSYLVLSDPLAVTHLAEQFTIACKEAMPTSEALAFLDDLIEASPSLDLVARFEREYLDRRIASDLGDKDVERQRDG
ncbi:helix-turn-helix transcriptional regulator [Candidatus Uhrbacteria bacterium]|nr:helix-turn-helix transcriptional regulator [Candidatus Uhrbacteria bacterium]